VYFYKGEAVTLCTKGVLTGITSCEHSLLDCVDYVEAKKRDDWNEVGRRIYCILVT
jgi:hypothetical protein